MHSPLQPLEEVALSNMWGIAALVEVLERKGLLTRDEIRETIQALQERHREHTSCGPEPGARPANEAQRGKRDTRSVFRRV